MSWSSLASPLEKGAISKKQGHVCWHHPWTKKHTTKKMSNELQLVDIPLRQRSTLKKKKNLMNFNLSTSPFGKGPRSKKRKGWWTFVHWCPPKQKNTLRKKADKLQLISIRPRQRNTLKKMANDLQLLGIPLGQRSTLKKQSHEARHHPP